VTTYFDDRVINTKTQAGCLGYNSRIAIFQFCDFFTTIAYQKLGRTLVARAVAGNKRVPGFNPVSETFIEQEFQCPIYDRWRNHGFVFDPVKAGQYFVGAHRLM